MKDLLVYAADADAEAFVEAILNRPQALGIRSIDFDIERHPLRDAGMVQSGAELARMKKGKYHRALLMWDHHGSGRDHRQTPAEVEQEIQNKLDSYTWSGNSAVTVLVPELEQWLWFCENALVAYCDITVNQLAQWQVERATKLGTTVDTLKARQPKELFEHVMRERLKRTISPRDFKQIGQRASVKGLLKCPSFLSITEALRSWFPADPDAA
ncbi:hypothetical protein E3Z27_23725 [Pseudomonas mediterranea]|jgi:hypothetical protein|uniref:methylation-associated defense system protein MAD4 n=1 Tax=Pseudomonas mediterranea TaxID=183795 RepID=UPI001317150A|nr:hypothetical protein [Pseudomonas mediterranea]QHA84455.1 hypothetical protein E3Z27_23725 [Pseudomonas mediterranea]